MEYIPSLTADHPNWVDVDIEKVCRICLQPEEDLLLIFDELNFYNKISLAKMITECSNCTVERHDDYPHQICLKCVEVLKISYNFRLKCRKSHTIAKLVLNNGKEPPRIPIIDTDNLPPLDKFTQTEALSFFPCEKCDEKFTTIEKLRTHRYYNHKGTCHECRVCNKSFRRIIYLKNHLAFYHPELGYTNTNECDICFKKFGRTEHLRRHQIKVHNQDLYKKNTKEVTSTIEDPLTDNSIKKYICKLCSAVCDTENDLNKHSCSENIEVPIQNGETIKIDTDENHFENDAVDLFNSDDQSDDEDLQPLSKLKKEIEYQKKDDLNKTSMNLVLLPKPEETIKLVLFEKPKEKINDEHKIEHRCNICQKLFTRAYHLRRHELSHLNIKPAKKSKVEHRCNMCQKLFTRAYHLRRHERSHLNIKPYNCVHCNKTFTRSDHLNNHMTKFHSEEQPFKCEICKKGFVREEHLIKHQNNCTNEQLSAKIKKPKLYMCEICKKGFTTERHQRVHMDNHNSKTFTCKFCKMVYKTKTEYLEHLKTHDNQKPFLCSLCGLRFPRNDYLIIHMRRHNGEKPYKCKFCDKGFPRATDLTVHERYHTGEKTHLCVTCGKGFHRAYNLVVHMRVHTGERPYKCSHCSKSFTQGNDLKAHIRRHTGERFRCEICDEGFIQGYHLTQHKKSAHGIDQPSHIRRLEKVTPNQEELVDQTEELVNQTEELVYHTEELVDQTEELVDSEEIKNELSIEYTNDEKPNDYENAVIFYTTANQCSPNEVKFENDFE